MYWHSFSYICIDVGATKVVRNLPIILGNGILSDSILFKILCFINITYTSYPYLQNKHFSWKVNLKNKSKWRLVTLPTTIEIHCCRGRKVRDSLTSLSWHSVLYYTSLSIPGSQLMQGNEKNMFTNISY